MEDLPEGFVLYTEWPEYLEDKMCPAWMQAGWIGKSPHGLRRNVPGLFFVETYTSDKEPVLERAQERDRLIIWQPLSRSDIPLGWKRNTFLELFFDLRRRYKEGYVRLDTGPEKWSETQRRMRRRWIANTLGRTHDIESISREEFWDVYKKSRTWTRISKAHGKFLLQKTTLDTQEGHCIDYRVVRDIHSREILAGLATLDSATHNSSYYLMAFVHPEDKTSAMTGLVDDWFSRSREKGFSTVQFGRFRSARFPKSYKEWEGFSNFKSTFGTRYIEFPPVLFTYIRGRGKRFRF